jgi:hypothetical protein
MELLLSNDLIGKGHYGAKMSKIKAKSSLFVWYVFVVSLGGICAGKERRYY